MNLVMIQSLKILRNSSPKRGNLVSFLYLVVVVESTHKYDFISSLLTSAAAADYYYKNT